MQFYAALPIARRRWFRFSLRTLLVVVTLLCILLGSYMKQKRDQQVAIETIKRWGARIEFGHQPSPTDRLKYQILTMNAQQTGGTIPPLAVSPPPGPQWLRQLLGDHFFAEVVSVRIPHSSKEGLDLNVLASLKGIERLSINDRRLIGRDELGKLAILPNLEQLRLSYMAVMDDGLGGIGGLTNLERLALAHTQITDAGLKNLRHCQSLEYVDISSTAITDAGLKHLQSLKSLTSVNVRDTNVTLEGIAQFRQALPNCEIEYTRPVVIGRSR